MCEAQGWEIEDNGEVFDLIRHTPMGYEYRLTFETEYAIPDLIAHADNFNVDHYVDFMLYRNKETGDVPINIELLLEDGRWIKMLLNLLRIELLYLQN